MAEKEGRTEQRQLKPGDSLGAKAVAGAPVAGGGVVVEVREKKGPLRAAIPTMPFPLAVICLFLNTFIPGLGKSVIKLVPSVYVWLVWENSPDKMGNSLNSKSGDAVNVREWRGKPEFTVTEKPKTNKQPVRADVDRPWTQNLQGTATKIFGGINQSYLQHLTFYYPSSTTNILKLDVDGNVSLQVVWTNRLLWSYLLYTCTDIHAQHWQ